MPPLGGNVSAMSRRVWEIETTANASGLSPYFSDLETTTSSQRFQALSAAQTPRDVELASLRSDVRGLKAMVSELEAWAPPPLAVAQRFQQPGEDNVSQAQSHEAPQRGPRCEAFWKEPVEGSSDEDAACAVEALRAFSDVSTDDGDCEYKSLPLFKAIRLGDETSALLLLSGVDPGHRTVRLRSVDTPRDYPVQQNTRSWAALPLRADSCDKYGRTALHCAASRGMLSLCRMLLEGRACTAANVWRDRRSRTPLHHAAAHGHARVCRALLDAAHVDGLDLLDSDGLSALHWAAKRGHARACKVLLGHPHYTAISATDCLGRTALHHAARNGHDKVCMLLLSSTRFQSVWAMDSEGLTPLHHAAVRGHREICELLVAHAGFQEWYEQQQRQAWSSSSLLELSTSSPAFPAINDAILRLGGTPRLRHNAGALPLSAAYMPPSLPPWPSTNREAGLPFESDIPFPPAVGSRDKPGLGPPTLAWQEKRHELTFHCGAALDTRPPSDLDEALGRALEGMESAVRDLAGSAPLDVKRRDSSKRSSTPHFKPDQPKGKLGVDSPRDAHTAALKGGHGEEAALEGTVDSAKSRAGSPWQTASKTKQVRDEPSLSGTIDSMKPGAGSSWPSVLREPEGEVDDEEEQWRRLAEADARHTRELRRLEEEEKRTAMALERRYERPYERPHERPYERPHGRPHERPHERLHERPHDRPYERPYEQRSKEEKLRLLEEAHDRRKEEARQRRRAEEARLAKKVLQRVAVQVKVLLHSNRTLFGKRIHNAAAFFDALDRDGSGFLKLWEVAEGLRRLDVAVSEDELMAFFNSFDFDNSGRIDRAELVRGLEAVAIPSERREDFVSRSRSLPYSESKLAEPGHRPEWPQHKVAIGIVRPVNARKSRSQARSAPRAQLRPQLTGPSESSNISERSRRSSESSWPSESQAGRQAGIGGMHRKSSQRRSKSGTLALADGRT